MTTDNLKTPTDTKLFIIKQFDAAWLSKIIPFKLSKIYLVIIKMTKFV
jgi:hypothetical protein